MKLIQYYFKNTQYPDNGCSTTAKAIQFRIKDLEQVRRWIKKNSGKIDVEKSREESYKHAQWLLESGKSYDYYLDEVNGIPLEDYPEEIQRHIGIYPNRSKWSKWTPERILEEQGWEPGEVYWFSISKDNTYDYQLILKEGDWICKYSYNRYFYNAGPKCQLAYSSDWRKINETKV